MPQRDAGIPTIEPLAMRTTMGTVRKSLLHVRSTVKQSLAPKVGDPDRRAVKSNPVPASGKRPRALGNGLQDMLVQSMWPLVESAFQGMEEHVEARFFQIDEFQVVVSRAPARGARHHEIGRRLTMELWPPVGPRVLVVEWIGRRPHIVQRRDGDWLRRLARIARQPR